MPETTDIKFICRGPRIDNTFLGCGEDLTFLINAIKPNGVENIITCPKCATEVTAMKSAEGKKIKDA